MRALAPAEIAWIALIPCALATLAAVLLAGPAVGRALFRPDVADPLWPVGWPESQGSPEPVELGRFLVAAIAPPLLAAVVLAGSRRGWRLAPRWSKALAVAGQALAVGFVVLAAVGQRDAALAGRPLPPVFGTGTLLAAAALTAAGVLWLRRRGAVAALARLARDTPARRAAGLAIAGAISVLWLLEGVVMDGAAEDKGVLAWTVNDAFAVLDGRTPLVDYHLLYAKLLPYPAALAMAALGATAVVYVLAMTALSALALLGVYGVFRRVVRGPLLALGLFAPFVALSDVGRTMTLTAMWPMRYGGAYLMAWLAARHLDGGGRRAWPLFAAGAVVAVDDLEFGVAALVATVAALACARPPASLEAVLRLAGAVLGGVLAGLAGIALLTLVRAGVLPDWSLLNEWPRIFTRLGWFSLPMPRVSLHLALYATFAAAIVLAAVRMAQSRADVLLTGMLAWSGVFGLLAGGYYAGRSDDLKLVSMLSAWAFALMLLTVATVRAATARGWRRPAPAQLLVLLGFALGVCSLVRFPAPWQQIERIASPAPPTYRPAAERFVAQSTRRGQRVAILMPMGHRVAYDLGLVNVSPYATQDALVTRGQLQNVIDDARREGAHAIFLLTRLTAPEHVAVLQRAGFAVRTQSDLFVELTDD